MLVRLSLNLFHNIQKHSKTYFRNLGEPRLNLDQVKEQNYEEIELGHQADEDAEINLHSDSIKLV